MLPPVPVVLVVALPPVPVVLDPPPPALVPVVVLDPPAPVVLDPPPPALVPVVVLDPPAPVVLDPPPPALVPVAVLDPPVPVVVVNSVPQPAIAETTTTPNQRKVPDKRMKSSTLSDVSTLQATEQSAPRPSLVSRPSRRFAPGLPPHLGRRGDEGARLAPDRETRL